MRKLLCLVFTFLIASLSPALAHYNMLLPSAASGKKGEAVTFTYQWGHPFEHQLFDAPKPEKVTVWTPDGKTEDVTARLEKVALDGEKGKVTGYRFSYKPEQRGDYVIVLQAAPILLKEEEEIVHDVVKVVFHVQAQKGWENQVGGSFEWQPLTRPYGLEPGMVFQAQIREQLQIKDAEGPKVIPMRPLAGAMIEVERYNATPPKKLPPDEQITRVVRTDPNGIVTCTLTDAGWWAITAVRDAGKAKHDGKEYPQRQRSTLWVFVDEKVK